MDLLLCNKVVSAPNTVRNEWRSDTAIVEMKCINLQTANGGKDENNEKTRVSRELNRCGIAIVFCQLVNLFVFSYSHCVCRDSRQKVVVNAIRTMWLIPKMVFNLFLEQEKGWRRFGSANADDTHRDFLLCGRSSESIESAALNETTIVLVCFYPNSFAYYV